MKCEKCGGNLTLEDVVCPYCEALNQHAVEHIREMNRYKKDYEGTKQEVYSATKNYIGVTVRLIIIAILVVLTVFSGILLGESYSIRRSIVEVKTKSNAKEYTQIMEQYLAEREFYEFSMFCEANEITAYGDILSEYGNIVLMTNQYRYIYDYVMTIAYPREGQEMQLYIKWIGEYLDGFYKVYDREKNYLYDKGDEARNLEIAGQVQEQIHALLMAYCGLSQEDIDKLPTATSAERLTILEKGINYEK